MKRLFMLLMFVLPMAMASHHAFAQEVTITLMPGWNWISYSYAEPMGISEALGDFVPMNGDIINSQFGTATYNNGQWRGQLQQFTPGMGYMYYSARTAPENLVFGSSNSLSVTTTTPTDITAYGATCGGVVTDVSSDEVIVRGVCLSTEQNPTIAGPHTTDSYGTGGFSSLVGGLSPNTTYHVRAYAMTIYGFTYGNELTFTTLGHGCVDLGLPSGLLWATCNVGAGTPEGYGNQFAWGETQPKNFYEWSNYQYSINAGYGYANLTKYCTVPGYSYNGMFTDNLTVLLPEDDAATVNWGDDWRMPTKEECQELLDNTTQTSTNQNGVYGVLYTASNGNSIFLPNSISYWTSSLYTDFPIEAWYFDNGWFNDAARYEGRYVRAVCTGISFVINAFTNTIEGGVISGGGIYQEGANCTLTAMANEGYIFINWTENGEEVSNDATYSFTVNSNRILMANFVSTAHSYVDLGLPSGTLWATCNVGAYFPEEYGDYFAWGETQPKDYYDWSTYQYCNGNYNTLTKYCNNSSYGYNGFTDNLTTLLSEDDAATANWGSDWRMPTKEEWQEICNNTTVTWAQQNGVNGRLFTASNGNSLFLPAAGHFGSSLYEEGRFGYYWSSSLYTDYPIVAWVLGFDSGSCSVGTYGYRDRARPVRPVRSSRQN